MTYTLQRDTQTPEVTLGHITAPNGQEVCKTLELPWRDNEVGRSCIPAGSYQMVRRKSHLNGGDGKHTYDVFELVGVPGRDAIEIHIGNTVDDTDGCILLGRQIGKFGMRMGITYSALTFAKWMARFVGILKDWLVIYDAPRE